jgi:glycosyltransferase involved in cell wall biosynthesis
MSSPVRHVALNALFLAPNASGGPETYMRGLVPALASEFPDTRFTVVTTRAGAAKLRGDGWTDFAGIVELPADEGETAKRTWAEQVLLPRAARELDADVLHSLASVAPVAPRMKAVITLHDVTFLRIRTFGAVTTAGMRAIVTTAARRADALVTGSAAARDEIAERLGIAPDRFIVAHHGAGRPPDVEPAPEDEVRRRYGLKRPRIVLCVGAKRPHKNQELLVRALDHLPDDVGLVLAGHAEPYEAKLQELVASGGHADRVSMPGYVPDADLESLWRLAGCIAFPTLGEGFGLPVVEAMGRGVAVACSDIDVLREVGGDVAHYFDPHDPAGAAAAITAAMDDPDAAERGRSHAAAFTWENSARVTFEAYERALF